MTKSTHDVPTCFVFKSPPEAFISPLSKKSLLPSEGEMPPLRPFPHSGAMHPHIIWLALLFLPSYAPAV